MADIQVNAVKPDRKMAWIAIIKEVTRVEKTDKLVMITFNNFGWSVVANTDNSYKPSDKVVYFCLDSVLDKKSKYTDFLEGKPLKTKKIRGVYSQGLIAPLDIFNFYDLGKFDLASLKEGDDVTEILGVKKYVDPEENGVYDINSEFKPYPLHLGIPKTDESRVQTNIAELKALKDQKVTVTIKNDGQSCSFGYISDNKDDGNGEKEFVVCSRNYRIERIAGSKNNAAIFSVVDKYDLEKKMRSLNKNIFIQGEVYGPGVNCNRHQEKEVNIAVFNIYDIDKQQYLDWDRVKEIAGSLNLPLVETLYDGIMKEEWLDYKNLLKFADKQEYSKGVLAEGVVIKNNSYPRISLKAISNSYLEKHKK